MTEPSTHIKPLLWALAGVILLSVLLGTAVNQPALFGLPLLALLGYITLIDFRKIFWLLLLIIPFSMEVTLPGGLGTDLPAEPLMLLLLFVYLVFALQHPEKLRRGFLFHPITLLVLLHLIWIGVTTITAANLLVSFKFFLAKSWYIVAFYLLAGFILREPRHLRIFFWLVAIPLMLTVAYVLYRHAGYGFSFKDSTFVVRPFYRNHVDYACILALFFPFIWFIRSDYTSRQSRWWVVLGMMLVTLIAIQFSYTRAAYVAIVLAAGAYIIVKLRLMKVVLFSGLLVAVLGSVFLINGNNYLDYAPEFKTTVAHKDFDNLLEATYKGEDVSTMERVYRWVAGMHMSIERPLMGFGPGNFYGFYKSYTVTRFTTYVSDNPEQSGIHSYYLMTLVEQGIPGLAILLTLCFVVLIRGETIYHRCQTPQHRRYVIAAILSFTVICALNLINDLNESVKVGPFFFMNMAILVNLDLLLKDPKYS